MRRCTQARYEPSREASEVSQWQYLASESISDEEADIVAWALASCGYVRTSYVGPKYLITRKRDVREQ